MIPEELRPLFWDVDVSQFDPSAFPSYTISRVLEFGDDAAVAWLWTLFPVERIREELRTERRLSPRSANYWSIVLGVPRGQIAAFQPVASEPAGERP